MEPAVSVALERVLDFPRSYGTGRAWRCATWAQLQVELEARTLAGSDPTAGGILAAAGGVRRTINTILTPEPIKSRPARTGRLIVLMVV